MLVRSSFLNQFLFEILLCVVLKGSKPLPSIRTKLHAELFPMKIFNEYFQ
jgi:hypothetical protein